MRRSAPCDLERSVVPLLSVIIATRESQRALPPTLAALVPGAAAGLVREVIIADSGSRDATSVIADAAGCRLLASPQMSGARLRAAAQAARSVWLLFLEPGCVPELMWRLGRRGFVLLRTGAVMSAAGRNRPVQRGSRVGP
jgi:hypothetical protein